ncbi:HTH domain-containing protein [Pusillimonas caeni]|uniref:HVO_A0114 family putative DNA-binding protein n=1 Tax=Pusillimonas caeni TaxID=1348472 RepID=UPI000E59C983|nr:HTH domain-containing protein [Pusillimonas caeni]TFL08829.1 HTH domain-containing protein [Pusillimonas caeni]
MKPRTLHVKVGEDPQTALKQFASTLTALEQGKTPRPYFGLGFENVGQLFAVFTPRRWELLAVLRQSGPVSVAELARRLSRDYKNVYNDVAQLIEWQVIEKNSKGKVFAPYSEISVDVRLPCQNAA